MLISWFFFEGSYKSNWSLSLFFEIVSITSFL